MTYILLIEALRDPFLISIACWIFIGGYYVVSYYFIKGARTKGYTGPWRKNGALDVITSVLWCLVAALLLASLLDLTIDNRLSLQYLVQYYFFFVFLFGFIYGILHWHWPGMLRDAGDGWRAEVKYIIISIQTITTVGYTTARPEHPVTELIACSQTLLGIFFIAVFIAKAVSAM